VALLDFFSNKTATKEETTAIEAPALSLTKGLGTVGTIIGGAGTVVGLIGAAGAKIAGPTAVKVAAIGGGSLVIIAVLGLAAVDMLVRQRAEEAKLRWGAEAAAPAAPTGRAAENGQLEVTFSHDDGDQVVVAAGGNGKTTVKHQT
jgi:hypothetical protein